jgi:signal peptidase II
LLADQVSKYILLWFIQTRGIGYREYITSGRNLIDITYATNPGAAFSILPNQQKLFIIITLIAMAGIIVYLLKEKRSSQYKQIALGLIFGGAAGNLIDRITRGEVIDFIDLHWLEVYHWPTFNIADSAICIGVGILIILILREPENVIPASVIHDLPSEQDGLK